MRGQGSPCIALPGHGICVGRRTTLLQLQQATQGPRSLQILSSICLLCHSFTVHGCARYTFVHVCHDNFLFGSPPKLSGLVNEAVAAGSHIVRTAPADESRPNVHRLLCRSQTGEPKTVPSLCVSTTLLRDNKASSQKNSYSLQSQSVGLARQHQGDVVDFQGGRRLGTHAKTVAITHKGLEKSINPKSWFL